MTCSYRMSLARATATIFAAIALGAQAQMSLPGQFAVNQIGAATYTVPIDVPPGAGGMQPKLSLTYNSQGADEQLGVGWSIGGLSTISRCPQTAAQDGPAWVGGITNTSDDRFCLDGQRLVNIPDPAGPATAAPGTYGFNGTYYSTERESFARVQSFGQLIVFNQPSYFVVKTKAGLTMEYGNATTARVFGTTGTVTQNFARVWALDKVSDAAGNTMSFTYSPPDLATGQYYVTRIDYAGNSNATPALVPSHTVFFDYDFSRPDVQTRYQAGGIVRTTARLTKISTMSRANSPSVASSASANVASYTLAYVTSAATQRSELRSITKCAIGGACLAPLTATQWSGAAPQFDAGVASTLGGWGENNHFYVADINGDGRADIIELWSSDGQNAHSTAWMATGSGYVQGDISTLGNWGGSRQFFFFDANGDGRTDLIELWSPNGVDGKVTVWPSTGNGFGPGVVSALGGWGSSHQFYLGDANGDGKTDIIELWTPDGVNARETTWLSGGTTYTQSTISNLGGWGSGHAFFMADVNGDGKTDIVELWTSDNANAHATNWISTGTGYTQGPISALGGWGSNHIFYIGDVNGDGRSDIIELFTPDGTNAKVTTWLSTDTAFVQSAISNLGNWPSHLYYPADLNGDGRIDLVELWSRDNATATATTWLSSGSTYAQGTQTTLGGWGNGHIFKLGDANGDGRTDVIELWSSDGSHGGATFFATSGPAPDRILSLDNGLGAKTAITYATPAQSGGVRYTQSLAATAPQLAIAPTWPVVTDVDLSNGRGGWNRTSYWYDSAVTEVSTGRGFSGFNYLQTQNQVTGLVSRTYWRRDFPFAGQIDRTTRGSSLATWNDLGEVTSRYVFDNFSGNCALQPGRRYFVYADQVDSVNNHDLTAAGQPGAGLAGSRTTRVMDSYGNPTRVVVQPLTPGNGPSGFNTVSTSTYSNDLNNWFLGRLMHSTVVSSTEAAWISDPVTGCVSVQSGTGGDGSGNKRTIQPVPPGASSRL